ncbi:MAG: hypothetical protein IKL07_00475 [Clostridium sp.]|nr:hypothetical protein [Clostridium sp.]
MDKQEAIRKIKEVKRNSAKGEIGEVAEEFDTFVNGMEYCLAVLEGRAPEYRKKVKCESENNTKESN